MTAHEIIFCALLGAAVLLLIMAQRKQGEAQKRALEEQSKTLYAQLESQRQQLRELAAMLGQAGQGQTALLESMQRQVLMNARSQEERLSQMGNGINDTLGLLDARMEQVRQATTAGLTEMRRENNEQLTEMRRTVDERLTQSLDKRLNESFAQVSERLERVYRGLGEMQQLAAGVGDLKRVLTNVKTRGIWGEMQLGALLSSILTREQYAENVEVVPGSGERVEFAIRLPGHGEKAVYLPIDSKFPVEDYLRLQEASQRGDAPATEASRKALCQRLRTEARRISSKYVKLPYSTDFAVLFLPVEGLYAEAVQQTALMEDLQRDFRVVVAGPSTFAALLNALQMGFCTLAIEQRSAEVWHMLGEFKTEFAAFADILSKTQQRLQQATESLDAAYARTRSIQRRLDQGTQLPGEEQPVNKGENEWSSN